SWQVAGKTGSAENPKGGTDAFFVGFAPASHPEVAFLVLLENAGHGGAEAAPVAKKLLNAYFQKRRRPVS
ncbi:MAG: penicillin-binding transpeptidase domain-containing protein, partial [bacterium]